jgi:uncharacterized surface protein with fasciclin (FAS1) repeats
LQLLQYHIVPASITGNMKTSLAGAIPLGITSMAPGTSVVIAANDRTNNATMLEGDYLAGDTAIIMVDRVLIPDSLRVKAG